MKYALYAMICLVVLAGVWIIYDHYTISGLERRNASLLKANDGMIVAMQEQRAQFQTKFDDLELKTRQLEATVTKLNTQYSALAKRYTNLQTKLASIKVPVAKEDRVAKYKELGYPGESIAQGAAAPYDGMVFDWTSSDKLLIVAMENPLIKEQNAILKEEVALLEKKATTQEQIIENAREETNLAIGRAEFAENQIVAKDKIISDLGKDNATLAKKAKRAKWWFVGGFVAGVVVTVGLLFGL